MSPAPLEPTTPSSTEEAPTTNNRYVLGLVRRSIAGTPRQDAEEYAAARRAAIRRLTELGEVIAEGPVEGPGDLLGIIVFRTASIGAARSLLGSDPMISSGQLVVELCTWLGPEGLRVGKGLPEPTDLDFTTD